MLGKVTYTFVMIKNPKRNPREPYIYFISDLQDAKAIAAHYLKRWKIECFFKNLKSNGFNIEDLNLKADQKIKLMVAILAVIYLFALLQGLVRHKRKPVKINKYKSGLSNYRISIFRMGYAIIQYLFTTVAKLLSYIIKLLDTATDKAHGLIIIKNVQ